MGAEKWEQRARKIADGAIDYGPGRIEMVKTVADEILALCADVARETREQAAAAVESFPDGGLHLGLLWRGVAECIRAMPIASEPREAP